MYKQALAQPEIAQQIAQQIAQRTTLFVSGNSMAGRLIKPIGVIGAAGYAVPAAYSWSPILI
ncbi:hypothetical protein CCR96_04405 [Halochromatium roseum]|nr:hypothetical protein [Halochromatium roseum]